MLYKLIQLIQIKIGKKLGGQITDGYAFEVLLVSLSLSLS